MPGGTSIVTGTCPGATEFLTPSEDESWRLSLTRDGEGAVSGSYRKRPRSAAGLRRHGPRLRPPMVTIECLRPVRPCQQRGSPLLVHRSAGGFGPEDLRKGGLLPPPFPGFRWWNREFRAAAIAEPVIRTSRLRRARDQRLSNLLPGLTEVGVEPLPRTHKPSGRVRHREPAIGNTLPDLTGLLPTGSRGRHVPGEDDSTAARHSDEGESLPRSRD